MNKWCGKIGFAYTGEIEPGLWVENEIIERQYFGDIISNRWRRENSGGVNENINISNQISIVADLYARDHVSAITWIEFSNEKWKITDVDVQFPRLVISIGGVYNG